VDTLDLADALADAADELNDVTGGGAAAVDDKIGVHGGDLGAADALPFQAGLVDQLPGGAGGGILEDAARAGLARLAFLALPAVDVDLARDRVEVGAGGRTKLRA